MSAIIKISSIIPHLNFIVFHTPRCPNDLTWGIGGKLICIVTIGRIASGGGQENEREGQEKVKKYFGTISERLFCKMLYLFQKFCATLMLNPSPPNYFAYLVRLWRSDESAEWRAIVQDPHTGQQFLFESPKGLFDFLQKQLGESPRVSTPISSVTAQEVTETPNNVRNSV